MAERSNFVIKGMPSEILTPYSEEPRRVRVSSRDSSTETTLNGFTYSIDHTVNAAASEVFAINLALASDAVIEAVKARPSVNIDIYNQFSTGDPSTIIQSVNRNLCSIDVSPMAAQLYRLANPQGDRIDIGLEYIEPNIISCETFECSIVFTNTLTEAQDIDFNIIVTEIGARNPLFGLTPSTALTPGTEMSSYG